MLFHDTIAIRFWTKVDKNGPLWNGTPCWLWTAGINRDGYGIFNPSHRQKIRSHRYSYELLVGPIPTGLQTDHLCRNRPCCNPNHLEMVTLSENHRRGNAGKIQAARTHCPQGHAYDLFNTRFDAGGTSLQFKRKCRMCDKQRHQDARAPGRGVFDG